MKKELSTTVDYTYYQLLHLRYGVHQGLDITPYANPAFTHRQMQEIIFGLEKGLDVSSYADPNSSEIIMIAHRKELESQNHETKPQF